MFIRKINISFFSSLIKVDNDNNDDDDNDIY
jgi:hypothetical protein